MRMSVEAAQVPAGVGSDALPVHPQQQGSPPSIGATEPRLFSYHLGEVSLYDTTGQNYKPVRAKLCHELCNAFGVHYETRPTILATRTDLGQFHADNYLGLLQIASELWAFNAEKAAKRAKNEDSLVKERLGLFQLGLPDDENNAVFSGMFAYLRLVATGTLAAAQALNDDKYKTTINFYGGHSRARKAAAQSGCFANDSVLACLKLLDKFQKVLHVSVDLEHCDGVEEAFYTSDRVFTVSFHSSRSTTGLEADIGHGPGVNLNMNFPLDKGSFCDDIFVPFFTNQITKIVSAYKPSAVVLVPSPSLIASTQDDELDLSLRGYVSLVDAVRALNLPLLILGGASASIDTTAKAWATLTTRILGVDIIGKTVPESCAFREHFSLNNYVIDAPARRQSTPVKGLSEKLQELEQRATTRLSTLVEVKEE